MTGKKEETKMGMIQDFQQMDEELGERMMFKYPGPNPPFNFCEIVVNWEEE
jgi:hypothetical protein